MLAESKSISIGAVYIPSVFEFRAVGANVPAEPLVSAINPP
jgi:hypothetical protein